MPSIHTNRGIGRARSCREALGLEDDGPLPDLLEAVEGAGAHVVVLDLGPGVAGAYFSRPGCPLLFVNGGEALVRQRFTLAHEFGHHWLGHASVVDQKSAMSDYRHDPSEVEANSFAAEFLIPRAAVERWFATRSRPICVTLEDVVRLAAEFGISAQMVRYRLATCRLLDDPRRRDALDAEIAEDLHIALAEQLDLEELDDALASATMPRIPPALRGSALGELLAGSLGVEEFAARAGQPVAAVRRMLANLGLDQLVGTG